MDVKVNLRYSLDVSPQEFRVISAALRGTLKEEWRAEALALQERMQHERHEAAIQLVGETQKVVNNIEATKVTP